MDIRLDDLSGPEISVLLQTHIDDASKHSPSESVHALDMAALRAPEITFWTAWENSELLGCGALKDIGKNEGEIKSMHTAAAHRGKGVAAAMVGVIVDDATRREFKCLYLETGTMEAFAPARALYRKFGFTTCEPFGAYRKDPFSTYMKLRLTA